MDGLTATEARTSWPGNSGVRVSTHASEYLPNMTQDEAHHVSLHPLCRRDISLSDVEMHLNSAKS